MRLRKLSIGGAFAAALTISAPAPGAADDSLVVEACKRAVAHWTFSDKMEFAGAQDFSNLKPPRARLRLKDLLSTNITCTFRTGAAKPLGLAEFCTSMDCFKAGDRRFDEAAELLKREGY